MRCFPFQGNVSTALHRLTLYAVACDAATTNLRSGTRTHGASSVKRASGLWMETLSCGFFHLQMPVSLGADPFYAADLPRAVKVSRAHVFRQHEPIHVTTFDLSRAAPSKQALRTWRHKQKRSADASSVIRRRCVCCMVTDATQTKPRFCRASITYVWRF